MRYCTASSFTATPDCTYSNQPCTHVRPRTYTCTQARPDGQRAASRPRLTAPKAVMSVGECLHAHFRSGTPTRTPTHTCTPTRTHSRTCTHSRTYTHAHLHAHLHLHPPTHIHPHTYLRHALKQRALQQHILCTPGEEGRWELLGVAHHHNLQAQPGQCAQSSLRPEGHFCGQNDRIRLALVPGSPAGPTKTQVTCRAHQNAGHLQDPPKRRAPAGRTKTQGTCRTHQNAGHLQDPPKRRAPAGPTKTQGTCRTHQNAGHLQDPPKRRA